MRLSGGGRSTPLGQVFRPSLRSLAPSDGYFFCGRLVGGASRPARSVGRDWPAAATCRHVRLFVQRAGAGDVWPGSGGRSEPAVCGHRTDSPGTSRSRSSSRRRRHNSLCGHSITQRVIGDQLLETKSIGALLIEFSAMPSSPLCYG